MEKLAASGLRYNRFHTTALCSPTRASLITGCNHHNVHTGMIMERSLGYPGYDAVMPKSAGTIAEILRLNGYNTAWFGKNHNVPDWLSSAAGPFDLWPTNLGFEYFYGFIGGDVNQWDPTVFENTIAVEPKEHLKAEDKSAYHFDSDLADHAIQWIRQQQAIAPDKPFFAYYAPGATHAPHHAPKEWIGKFKGKFDQGWDKVREETYTRQKKKLGGPRHYNHFPVPWTWAMNAPMQWTKRYASHLGGTRNGMVMSWPKRIKDKGGLRQQFHHVIDIAPTILEAAGVQAPESLNGVAQIPIRRCLHGIHMGRCES